jgi:hypothetical protein
MAKFKHHWKIINGGGSSKASESRKNGKSREFNNRASGA